MGEASDRLVSVDVAADMCGVSDDSIRRRLKAGRLPRARMVGGRWTIPVEDLIRAGLRPVIQRPTQVIPPPGAGEAELEPPPAGPEVARLRTQLAEALSRAAVAEALAAARADHIADLRAQLGLSSGQLALFSTGRSR